ncbi:hypothetical protein GCM10008927_09060 [Amylibacter ulvae]|uniref:Chromosomal replication initiator protein DnaA domain-containing protein n=1 Tax=Paramylibacter ulvae TaxID=1651968 RepID=A0ABQ3CW36_9RHOB|nr:DnaA/Hda family protein [Amylibacter ulvae]GHA46067.1 hypothetical protein GCM10008927_09060 [Amylibacter ulvae]
MAEQLILDLPVRQALGREDFFVSPSNQSAVDALDAWHGWTGNKLILLGPKGAGKTHLAQIWAQNADGIIVAADDLANEDIPSLATQNVCVEDIADLAQSDGEQALFHLHNAMLDTGKKLLLTGRDTPRDWQLLLPDLNSRLAAIGRAQLEAPDDMLLMAVMIKQFEDRQIAIDPAVVNFLIPRVERSFAFVAKLVAKLDETALAARKPISRKLARIVLDSLTD